jgi:RNA polymerase sigma-70 factor, ECF subfamily
LTSQAFTFQECISFSGEYLPFLELKVLDGLFSFFAKIADIVVSVLNQAFEPAEHRVADGRDDGCYVSLCQQGNRRAFDELVIRHQDKIFSLCVRLLGNRAEGEDAAQEAFVKAYEALNDFKGNAAFSTWLYSIAVNVCRNKQASFWNRFSRKAVRLDEEIDSEDGFHKREIPGHDKNPEEMLAHSQKALFVRTAIYKLPPKLREVIVLADLQDLSYEEIQSITSLPLGTIKSRIARGRENLKIELKGLSHEN